MSQTEDRWTPRARVEPAGPEAHARDELDDLLEGSSLGSPVVKRIQSLVPARTARRALARRSSLSAGFDVNELVSRILAAMCRQALAHRTGARLAGGQATGDLWWLRHSTCPGNLWQSPGGIVLGMPPRMRAALRVIEQPGGPDRVLRQLVHEGALDEVRDDVARRIALLAAALMDDAPPGLLRAYAVVLELKSPLEPVEPVELGERPPLIANEAGREGRRGREQSAKGSVRRTSFPVEDPRPARRYFAAHDRHVGGPPPFSTFLQIARPGRFSDLLRFILNRHDESDPSCAPHAGTGPDLVHPGLLSCFSYDAGKWYRSFRRAVHHRLQSEAWTRCPDCQHEWAVGWPSSTINVQAARHMLTSCAPTGLGRMPELTPHRLLLALGHQPGLIDFSLRDLRGLLVRVGNRELLDRLLRQRVRKREEAAVTEAAEMAASSCSAPARPADGTMPRDSSCSRCSDQSSRGGVA
ncbi:hypothetical protein AB0C28_42735 [Nonomuraea sp. NPDC048892]|uniref:hypothetical protein n=1 Tax=Nonomuraea sp. NPDC048892 TaxID=3154624 RepID=UPI0033DA083C